jgi:predicted ATPase
MKQFGAFVLDTKNECLWRDGLRLCLTPKPFAVLRFLVENPQRLVTHDELLDALWKDTFVQPQVLRTYVLDIRRLLGDDPEQPEYLLTVPKRGYRFLMPVTEVASGSSVVIPSDEFIIGRAKELEELRCSFERAVEGERCLVFIKGEAGIGKTALIDAFCQQLGSNVRIARGQCIEGFAGKESYYPVIEALAELSAATGGDEILRILTRLAPGCLERLPSRLHTPAGERGSYASQPVCAPGEICDALEAIAAEQTLVLVFEDLHWADASTLQLISALARRRLPAHLLMLSSYLPAEVSDSLHPLKALKQDLLTRRLCNVITLLGLDKEAVRSYISRELNQPEVPSGLTSFVSQYSEGNPLFMGATIEHLRARRFLVHRDGVWQLRVPIAEIDLGVPEALSEMIELRMERLDDADQRLLEAGSIIGVVFPSWAAAAALNADLVETEEDYQRLARQLRFLHVAGQDELADGTRSTFYVFAHSLYREVLYHRQTASRRARWHLRVAERIQLLFAGREADVALELAQHLEGAGEWSRAADALAAAALQANHRRAIDESEHLQRRALELVEHLPQSQRLQKRRQLRESFSVDPQLT